MRASTIECVLACLLAPEMFAPNKGIKELIEKFDDGGPAAFEDEPGTWFYTNNENGGGRSKLHITAFLGALVF
eukprot:1159820-Pelagomonas_calceolata.AAC.8